MSSKIDARLAHPFYTDHVFYHAHGKGLTIPTVRAWAFNGWRQEGLSWHEGCYIHAGLSGSGPLRIKGPQAKEYLQSIVVNSLEKFPVGSMKHAVQCNADGLITAHGILSRLGEDEFESWAGGPPGPVVPKSVDYDVEITDTDKYLFQVAGPKSLEVLEKVTGEDLRDLKFLRFRNTAVAGHTTEVARLGMVGSLAFELRGPMADAADVYDAVYEVGKAFGMERLGWGTYLVNHIEGGFPQHTWTFISAMPEEIWPRARRRWEVSGSVDPAELRPRLRTPVEVRWDNMVKFDHDFTGRDAVAAEIENPRRRTVTLRWNHDDVLDLYASLVREPEPYKTIDFPYAPQRWPMAHADHVTKGGRQIGWSSGTVYSPFYREYLSHGCLDISETEIGETVSVHWGDHGGPIKEIRATVERFPYYDGVRNSEVDLQTGAPKG
ncbi:hypothetical protein [Maritimibacter dapengensis]|uniref:GCVT N-terminal domain-containing protein n=1 Tax=Maritimibacter dapengensis TaxID=2836868 RepID=A0ABS6T3W4_9RHOB|nr:hypothetical protein [Maritimibacter dapengensis]MBV7379948.1 hypothetical protein [Maritimibacter dapengensis]